jgi:hypothetical protein
MKELLDKLSSYNIFNYLLPGVLFIVALDRFSAYSFIQENLIADAFVYYFAGLVVSRFGSLVIEPILKNISFVKFANYTQFISASKKDSQIEIISEVNNMYRTLISMMILLLLALAYQSLEQKYPNLGSWNPYVIIILLLIIFLFSYKKQTAYIRKRIENSHSSE